MIPSPPEPNENNNYSIFNIDASFLTPVGEGFKLLVKKLPFENLSEEKAVSVLFSFLFVIGGIIMAIIKNDVAHFYWTSGPVFLLHAIINPLHEKLSE